MNSLELLQFSLERLAEAELNLAREVQLNKYWQQKLQRTKHRFHMQIVKDAKEANYAEAVRFFATGKSRKRVN